MCMRVKLLKSCLTLCNPMDCSPPRSSIHGISQQEYWSGLPFPTPRDLSDPRVVSCIPVLLFSCSVISDSLQPCGLLPARLPVLHCFTEFAQSHVHWVSDKIQPSYSLSLLLPSIFPSIGPFPSVFALRIRWPKYWSFIFSTTLSNEYSGLISFRTDWFDLLAVQGILKSLLQHHSLKALILWSSVFFMVQLSIQTWLLEKL